MKVIAIDYPVDMFRLACNGPILVSLIPSKWTRRGKTGRSHLPMLITWKATLSLSPKSAPTKKDGKGNVFHRTELNSSGRTTFSVAHFRAHSPALPLG